MKRKHKKKRPELYMRLCLVCWNRYGVKSLKGLCAECHVATRQQDQPAAHHQSELLLGL